MAKKKKIDKKKIKDLEERVEKLEEEKKELEKRGQEEEKGSIVESVLGGIIPGLGKFVRNLEKTSPEFAKKLEEADKEIEFRLKRGGSSKPHIEYHFSTRPLISGRGRVPKRRKEEPRTIIVWEETPPVEESDLKVYTVGRRLIIETKDKKYHKEILLSHHVKNIEWKYGKSKEKGMIMVQMKTR